MVFSGRIMALRAATACRSAFSGPSLSTQLHSKATFASELPKSVLYRRSHVLSSHALVRTSTPRLSPSPLHVQIRCENTWGRSKVASKRKTKKYKLKNHGGAVARWMVMGGGMFKRAQAGRSHLNRKMRVWKKKAKRRRVLANTTQRKFLRKLIPYHKRRYMR